MRGDLTSVVDGDGMTGSARGRVRDAMSKRLNDLAKISFQQLIHGSTLGKATAALKWNFLALSLGSQSRQRYCETPSEPSSTPEGSEECVAALLDPSAPLQSLLYSFDRAL